MQHMGWREKITSARKARGWIQTELSAKAQVRQGTVSDCESGDAYPKLDTVMKISDALGVTLSWLFSDHLPDEPPGPPDPEETAVRVLFERRLRSLGAKTLLDMLDEPSHVGRVVGQSALTREPEREDEFTDRPGRPFRS